MKSRVIVRTLDELGRVVMPIETRRMLGINDGDSVEYYFDDEHETIMVKKSVGHACLFCSSGEQLNISKNI